LLLPSLLLRPSLLPELPGPCGPAAQQALLLPLVQAQGCFAVVVAAAEAVAAVLQLVALAVATTCVVQGLPCC
jgi:hypothetical protein